MDLFQVGQILGFKPGETIDAASVKAKIREKSKENHPDVLQGAGISEAEIRQRRSIFETVRETGDRLVDALNGTGKAYTMPGTSKRQQDLADVLREKATKKQKDKQASRSEEDRRKYEAAQDDIRRNKEQYARQRNGGYQNNGNGYGSTGSNGGFNGNGNGQSNGNANGHTNGRSKESESERKRREEERIMNEFNRAREEAERKKERARAAKAGEEKRRAEQEYQDASNRAEDILFERDYFKSGRGSVSEEEAKRRGGTFFGSWRASRERFRHEREQMRQERERRRKKEETGFNEYMKQQFGDFWQDFAENQKAGAEYEEKIRQTYAWRANNPHAEDDEDRERRKREREESAQFAEEMDNKWNEEQKKYTEQQEEMHNRRRMLFLVLMLALLGTVIVKNRKIIGLGTSEKEYIEMEKEQIRKDSAEAAMNVLIEQARAREAAEYERKMKFVAELDTIQSYIIAIQKEKNYFTPLTESNPIFEGTYGTFQSGGIGVITSSNGRQYDCSFALYKKVERRKGEGETVRRFFVFVVDNKKTVIEDRNSKELYHLGPVEYQFSLKDIRQLKQAFAYTYYGR